MSGMGEVVSFPGRASEVASASRPIRSGARIIRVLAWTAAALILVVNLLGYTDTVTGSALGCGRDWPLCNGALIPSVWTRATVIEWTHRLSVLVAGPVVLVWAALAWIRYRAWWEARLGVVMMVGGVLGEGALGALAVMFVNPDWVMALHLGVALLALVGTYLLAVTSGWVERRRAEAKDIGLRAFALRANDSSDALHLSTFLLVVYGFIAIYVGAYVASTGAGAMFQGWPLPSEGSAVGRAFWLDVAHRSIALGLLVWLATLWMVYHHRGLRDMRRLTTVALVLVVLQAYSGWLLLVTHLSVPAFLIHVTIVSCIICCLSHLALRAWPDRRPRLAAKAG
ncbi:MAG: COX15/CtaA family protein [Thermoflavifilum sp.]|nr:COX15/CtaA family protein [Thermoflavifilum sp.]MCL6514096.1 COX15/CtaA family protein [Alicyclobacillus sp.]